MSAQREHDIGRRNGNEQWLVSVCVGGDGHLLVSCCKEGCPSVWDRPPYQADHEVTGRPGSQAKRQRKSVAVVHG